MIKLNIFWFRRDIRLEDNAGLYHALKSDLPVLPIFIFDTLILDQLENKADARVEFIYDSLLAIQEKLKSNGSALRIFYGTPANSFKLLLSEFQIGKVFTNEDYEPYGIKRDNEIEDLLKSNKSQLIRCKDQVIFEKDEVMKDDGTPYTVFTPFSKKWKAKLDPFYYSSYPTENFYQNLYQHHSTPIPTLEEMGFKKTNIKIPSTTVSKDLVSNYDKTRNFPGIEGTSRLGIHLRFGTISIRKLCRFALENNTTYLNELIWRDFYFSILFHFPKVGMHRAFKESYENIVWRNNEEEFKKWCEGNTGYAIVDAGMRQLNQTGYMHNRVRMITASFLTKHLLIDWKWGEAYFAEKLLDFDLASNNGGWQWAAGSGCDAAPYFRIFNPYLQTKKFDPELTYIKKWVPEFQEFTYPEPIVDHEFARKRCLEVYSNALKSEMKPER